MSITTLQDDLSSISQCLDGAAHEAYRPIAGAAPWMQAADELDTAEQLIAALLPGLSPALPVTRETLTSYAERCRTLSASLQDGRGSGLPATKVAVRNLAQNFKEWMS